MDSAVTLALAREQGLACHALSVDYGQRHVSELAAAKRVAQQLGAAEYKVVHVDLRSIGGSALTSDIEVPEAGVSGMTYWTHLTRDHSFDPVKIAGLTIDEQAKLHAAAHHGY